ncbi:MAG: CpaF family protein, partial [Actinobacteria bacterium]|nr:CpaF family protein [Actinomycetota bacterium]
KEIYEEIFEYGPVSDLMRDEKVTEIMINSWNEIYIEINGFIKKTSASFKSEQHLRNIMEKIISPLGLRLDESCPWTDARLENGSRINIVIPPISLKGMVVTIRKFKNDIYSTEDLLKQGAINRKISKFLKSCVEKRLNIIVSGAASTGKTTFLNIISNFISDNERIITIEDTLELRLNAGHVIRLEGRHANLEGRGEITLRDLIRNALRMRPDRIIVGEIRGQEAVDVLQAMNTGHEGSMTTIHANSPYDLISRLETMLLMSAANITPSSAKRIILASIDLIIHLERTEEGLRKVSCISELYGSPGLHNGESVVDVVDIFISCTEGKDQDFSFTGKMPSFAEKINWKEADFVA